ncbi:MAG: BrnT family toxin [Acidobacteria bacterium]|nr:BrnT family toxin [Acidobacteriota bacterium]
METEEFEWDDEKNTDNIRNHAIAFDTAIRAFDDERAIPFADREHSRVGEQRYALLGMCEAGLVFISFTYRGSRTRIISARRASRRMERIYAEND